MRVYLICARAFPPVATANKAGKAGKAGKATTVTLTCDDLSNPEAAVPADERM